MVNGKSLLLVDDDDALREALRDQLQLNEEFTIQEAASGAAALEIAKGSNHDLLILDVGLPDMDGREVCRLMRRAGVNAPIIMLTDADTAADTILGLDAGANDYVTKPFSPAEVIARLRAVLRRALPSTAVETLEYEDITLDLAGHRVERAGRNIHLGPTEFRLLRHLMEHPGRVYSREQLLDAVWGRDIYVEARTVDVHIRRLRKALNEGDAADLIRTVRSAGYALDKAG